MPTALMSREEVVERLFTVFRDRGYDGASLGDLSQATGLGRSSLYHHFPGGKEDMAAAVADYATALIERDLVAVAGGSGTLASRLRRFAAALDTFYEGGRAQCVLGQLACDSVSASLQDRLRIAFQAWVGALGQLAHEAGQPPAKARAAAEDLVAQLQGALVLRAATGDTAPFERSLKAIRQLADRPTG